MWDEIFSVAITNGLFACLFVALLVYELKDSRQREKKYQSMIESLASRMSSIETIKDDIEEIKQVVVYHKKDENNHGK